MLIMGSSRRRAITTASPATNTRRHSIFLVDGHGLKLFAHERELHGRVLRVLLVIPTEPGGEEREVGLPAEQGGVLRGFAAFRLGGEVVEAGEARYG